MFGVLAFLNDIQWSIRSHSLPIDTVQLVQETAHYTFATSLFDVFVLSMVKFLYCMIVWSYQTDKVALLPIFFSTAHTVIKYKLFIFHWMVDGVLYTYQRGYNLMFTELIFCFLEVLMGLLANIKMLDTRKQQRKFRVAGGRCPLCTLPLDKCPHKITPGKTPAGMKVTNFWHVHIFKFYLNCGICSRMFFTCWCPCKEGKVAENLKKNPLVFCCAYCILMPLCLFGPHGVVGAITRSRLRQEDKIEGTILRDLIYHWFCCPCALTQELAQLRKMQEDEEEAKRDEALMKAANPQTLTIDQLLGDLKDADGNAFAGADGTKAAELLAQKEISKALEVHAKFAKIRQKQFKEDLEIAKQELMNERFVISEDPLCPDGTVVEGDYGEYQKDRNLHWRKPSTDGPGKWKNGLTNNKRSVVPGPPSLDDDGPGFPGLNEEYV